MQNLLWRRFYLRSPLQRWEQSFAKYSFLKQLTRQNSKNIDSLCLYAPILMLKEINCLDTPGFNSQNHDDTKTTLDILKNVDGII